MMTKDGRQMVALLVSDATFDALAAVIAQPEEGVLDMSGIVLLRGSSGGQGAGTEDDDAELPLDPIAAHNAKVLSRG